MKLLDKSVTLSIGDSIKLNWHGFDDWLRVAYVWGDTIVALDRYGKPYNLGRNNIAEHQGRMSETGFFILCHKHPEAVQDDQIILSGCFNGAFWLISGVERPISEMEFNSNYVALEKFTTQNIMRVFDKMLVMLPVQDAPDEQ